MASPSESRDVNAFSTLPFAVVSYGTRRPTQFVPPTKWRESSCARCSTPSGVGTPRFTVSPDSWASVFNAGAASSARLSPPSRWAKRSNTGPGATRRSPARCTSPRRSSAPTSREVVDFGSPLPAASSPTASGRSDSTTLTRSSAARSIACVPVSAMPIWWNMRSTFVKPRAASGQAGILARRDLEAEAVRVAEERRVVGGVVLRPVARRVQHLGTGRERGCVRRVDVVARVDREREVVQPGRVELERLLGLRLPEAERARPRRGKAEVADLLAALAVEERRLLQA